MVTSSVFWSMKMTSAAAPPIVAIAPAPSLPLSASDEGTFSMDIGSHLHDSRDRERT